MISRILLTCVCAGAMLAETPTITLEDALKRARQYGGQIQSANLSALQAGEDRVQVHAGTLPQVNALNQFIYTQGNGTPSGIFVANDGVHVYNEQAIVHQELLSLVRRGEIHRAMAAEAIARAKIDVASRGLTAIVIQNYFAIVLAQRKYANAQISLKEAQRFFELSEKQEKGGEVARADVIKAQIDLQQRQRDVKESDLVVEKARIALGVLIFPNFSSDFAVVDDLQQMAALPTADEAKAAAAASSPEIKAATAGVVAAGWDVAVARYQFVPSLAVDFFYGIDNNEFAAHSTTILEPVGPSGAPVYGSVNRLGYSAQITLNIPVWNWGSTRSKIKQAEFRRDQAKLDLSLARRTLDSNLAAAYAESNAARAQLDSLKTSEDLAAESLRLTVLRYQAGEATALEVVDAQNTAMTSRNANDDGLARYRIAVENLKMLTGNL
ncbi:MAG TPA: TolC family protein [Bryobacteraceae bacterium]|nr:TolC family protein [Bryobacteraceae bacterium]